MHHLLGRDARLLLENAHALTLVLFSQYLYTGRNSEKRPSNPPLKKNNNPGLDVCGTHKFVSRKGVDCRYNTEPLVRAEPEGHYLHEHRDAVKIGVFTMCGIRDGKK